MPVTCSTCLSSGNHGAAASRGRAVAATALLFAVLACAASAAAAAEGAWLPPALDDPGDPASLSAPQGLALLIYNHGSRPEFHADTCDPLGATTPPVIKALAGSRLDRHRLVVFAFCTPSKTGSGEPKVDRRAREVAALARRFRDAGLPPARIFLAGHSAGGWASLLVLGRDLAAVNATVAFAPAFAGRRGGRAPGWRTLRRQQRDELVGAARLDALVFAFEGDDWERPRDLGFLDRRPDVELVALALRRIDGVACGWGAAHRTVFKDCFERTQIMRLRDYLTRRLDAAGRG